MFDGLLATYHPDEEKAEGRNTPPHYFLLGLQNVYSKYNSYAVFVHSAIGNYYAVKTSNYNNLQTTIMPEKHDVILLKNCTQ